MLRAQLYFLSLLFLLLISCSSSPSDTVRSATFNPDRPILEFIIHEVDSSKSRMINITSEIQVNRDVPSSWKNKSIYYKLYISEDPKPTFENKVGYDQTERVGYFGFTETNVIKGVHPVAGLNPFTKYYYIHEISYSDHTGINKSISTGVRSFTTADLDRRFGGIVYYDKGKYSDGWRYLIAAEKNWYSDVNVDQEFTWGCFEVPTNTNKEGYGDGFENTKKIVAANCENKGAAHFVDSLNYNGYDDWYLPAFYELRAYALFEGNDLGSGYWTSNDYNRVQAIVMGSGMYGYPTQEYDYKNTRYRIRPFRRE